MAKELKFPQRHLSLVVNEKEAILITMLWGVASTTLNKQKSAVIKKAIDNAQAFYKELSPDEHIALATKMFDFTAAISPETMEAYGLKNS